MNANSTKNNLPVEKTFNGIRFINFLCLTFSWIFIIPNTWKLGILLTLISVLTYVFSRKKANTEKRAYLYHLYVFLSFFPFSVLSVLASLRLFEKSIIDVQHYLLITGTILLVFLFTFQLFQRMLVTTQPILAKNAIYGKTVQIFDNWLHLLAEPVAYLRWLCIMLPHLAVERPCLSSYEILLNQEGWTYIQRHGIYVCLYDSWLIKRRSHQSDVSLH